MIKQRILEDLKKAAREIGFPSSDIVLSIPKNPSFGDYSTNLALQLAKLEASNVKQPASPSAKQFQLKRGESPTEIANKIVNRLQVTGYSKDYLEKIEVAGGGFINFFIKDEKLLENLLKCSGLPKIEDAKKIFIEYGHTNPLKEVHIGHLRTFILGESLARVLEGVGNRVFRGNYQGDIGLHIAKAIYGIQNLGLPSKELSLGEKAQFMGKSYAQGNKEYEQDQQIKKQIDEINISLYKKDDQYAKVYNLAREWSLDYFEPIYKLLGIKYDRCFFESEVFEEGKRIVLDNIGPVFEKSDGAIIFPGEKYGLHNRVFITSAGNPTYEGKEIGLAKMEYSTFEYDKAIHVVAHEQAGYFQVVFKAIEMIFPKLKGKKYHLSYGLVDLKEGKMSSRTGTVITVEDLYKVVSEKVREIMSSHNTEINQDTIRQIAVGAIKFSYLKFSPSPNMVFDLEQSVSMDGDSGPYVQYTYARIQSVLKKVNPDSIKGNKTTEDKKTKLEKGERMLLRQLVYFQDIVLEAASSYHTNLLASYLIELAKLYNLFYQENRIIGTEREEFRLKLSLEVSKVLQQGLYLLGIEAPERM